MRLTARARSVIRRTTADVFGQDARVRLFGSRVDDRLRGGDIDLLVEPPAPDGDRHRHSLPWSRNCSSNCDQRIDVLVMDPETPERAIHRQARATGILL